jgi:hypothetical protein
MGEFEVSNNNESLQSTPTQVSKRHGLPRKYDREAIVNDYKKGMNYSALSQKYGVSLSYAWWIVDDAGVRKTQSEPMVYRCSGTKNWRRLIRQSHRTVSRIVSIPASLLTELGYDPQKNLERRWVVQGHKLILEIREVGV